jgi:ATP-dependent Lon protease
MSKSPSPDRRKASKRVAGGSSRRPERTVAADSPRKADSTRKGGASGKVGSSRRSNESRQSVAPARARAAAAPSAKELRAGGGKHSTERPGKGAGKRPASARPTRKPTAPARLPKLREYVVLAVRGMALFPGVVLPVGVGRPRSVRAVQAAIAAQRPIAVLLQKNAEADEPRPEDLYRIGTIAEILRYITAPDGSHHIIVHGERRFRAHTFRVQDDLLYAQVELLDEEEEEAPSTEVEARFLALKQQARAALELLPQKPEDLEAGIVNSTSPAALTDMVATFMDLPPAEKQDILETLDLKARMHKVASRLQHMMEVLQISRDIQKRTKGTLEKAQRDYFLREQLKTIQKELGEGQGPELDELKERIVKAELPPEAEKEARKELARLERMNEASAEYSMVRTYLDWMLDLPWSKSSEDALDLLASARILDEDHYGLDKVKRRILEALAVRKLKPTGKSPILCLVGPPGVGKTSLGQSIARCMNRKFVRVALGGVHDEAEIRGHRRTYVGALPGNIVQGLRKAGTNNPVFMLDELDKLSASFQGDPSSALLEVLDPEQNHTFRDNYLAVPFDLSRIFFLGTANVLDQVPGPLRDRLEVIELSGYTEGEKLEIARRYLIRRQIEANGLLPDRFEISGEALVALVRHYTREAGCRSLERQIGALCRHAAMRVAKGEATGLIRIEESELHAILGAARFENEVLMRTGTPGVATGLAWTPVGGDVLFIEAAKMAGKGELVLTGQLGDVMKESARAAISLLRSNAAELGIDAELIRTSDLHVHFPAGAIPKDGPSAGVTIYSALVSLFTGRPVKSDVAMTGEISLRGLVLPVGGIKEKVLAAYRAGIHTVLLPARNMKDLEDIPQSVRDNVRFVPLERVEQALSEAFDAPRA